MRRPGGAGPPKRRQPSQSAPLGPKFCATTWFAVFFAMPGSTHHPGLGLELQGITSGPLWERVGETILGKNGVDHHRLRKLVSKVFTPRGAERLRAAIVAVITELLDQVTTAGSCDVVAQIARPYPVPVICAALGAPRGDWQLISHWADELTNMTRNAADESAVLRELGAWDSYIDDMVATRRRNLTDDLLSDLIRAEADGERLTAEELRALVGTLLMAGTDTTRNQLAASVEALCEHPRQWELLGRRPEMAPRAVEETMRYTPVLFTALRMATEDVELDGVLIRSGTLVVVNTGAANRDPDVFDNPDQLDITRDAAPPMLTFGNGAHYCLGAHLARIELAEALRLMAQRMPNIRRAGEARVEADLGNLRSDVASRRVRCNLADSAARFLARRRRASTAKFPLTFRS